MNRYAYVAGPAQTVARYLPGNYDVLGTAELEGREVTVIGGSDNCGWTLDGYVLPRLSSGLYFGQEINPSHPILIGLVFA
jgi:hypothetical protein